MILIQGSSAPQNILPESIPCVSSRGSDNTRLLSKHKQPPPGVWASSGTSGAETTEAVGDTAVQFLAVTKPIASAENVLTQPISASSWGRESSPVTSFLVKHYPRWTHWASDTFAVAHQTLWSHKNPNTPLKRQCLPVGCVRLKTWHWEGRQFFLMLPGDWLSDPPYLHCLKTECQGRCSRPSFLANELHKIN